MRITFQTFFKSSNCGIEKIGFSINVNDAVFRMLTSGKEIIFNFFDDNYPDLIIKSDSGTVYRNLHITVRELKKTIEYHYSCMYAVSNNLTSFVIES
jgi:hypothetical protein